MKTKRAFTLIELLVVIAIIGVLATISVIALQNARAKARDVRRVADVKQMQTALELFFNDMGRYPTIDEINNGSIYSISSYGTTTYMAAIPVAPATPDGSCDPNQNQFYYNSFLNGSSYSIGYCLGNTVGALAAGTKCATPSGVSDADCSNLGYCLNPNPDFEIITEEVGEWNLRGASTSDFSDYSPTSPVKSGEANSGNYGLEFKGNSNYLSLATFGALLNSGSSYTARLYVKGSGNLMVLFGNNNGGFWNFTLNQWDSGVNPFSPDYSWVVSPSTNYTEFVVPSVIGPGSDTNLILASLNGGIFVDDATFKADVSGTNLIDEPSFENWTAFPDGWSNYVGQTDGIMEVENNLNNVYSGGHSMKIGNGASYYASVELMTKNSNVQDNFDIKFFAKSSDASPAKQIEIWVRTNDQQYYYNFNTQSWQLGGWIPGISIPLTNEFQEYIIEDIPPPPAGGLNVTFLPGSTANAFNWIDRVCVVDHD